MEKPESTPTKRRRKLWLWIGLSLAVVGSATAASWYFVKRQLSPLISEQLTTTLDRPFELGAVTHISPHSITFGPSSLPPTPDDPDYLHLESLTVSFNPLNALFKKAIAVDITVNQPELYLEQDQEGSWINLKVDAPKEEGAIEVALDDFKLRDGTITLVPRDQANQLAPAVSTNVDYVNSQFKEQNDRLDFELAGNFAPEAKFKSQGQIQLSSKAIAIEVQGQNLPAQDVTSLIPLPLRISQGRVDGDLAIMLNPAERLLMDGEVVLNGVTGKIAQLPQPFSDTNGKIRFDRKKIDFTGVTTNFAQLQGVAQGYLDLENGYALSADVAPAKVRAVLDAFNLPKLNFPLTGEVGAKVNIIGALNSPITKVSAQAVTPVIADRFQLKDVKAELAIMQGVMMVRSSQGQLVEGGQINARGQIAFPTKTQPTIVALDVSGRDVNTTAIAAKYRPQPLPINLGPSSFTSKIVTRIKPEGFKLNQVTALGTATMTLGQGQVKAQKWQLDRGQFSSQVGLNNINLRQLYPTISDQLADSNFQGQGTVQAQIDNFQDTLTTNGIFTVDTKFGRANIQRFNLQRDQWQALASTSVVNLGQVAPSLAALGGASGTFTLNGNLTTQQITGSGLAETAGGVVTVENIAIDRQTWAAKVKTRNVNIAPIAKLPSEALANSSFQVAGLIGNVGPETLQIAGTGQIRLGQGQIMINRANLKDGRWQAGVTAQNLNPRSLNLPTTQNLGGAVQVSGLVKSFDLNGISLAGNGYVRTRREQINVPRLSLNEGQLNLTASLGSEGLRLAQFNPQLKGHVKGELKTSLNLNNLNPSQITAQGDMFLTQGLPFLDRPLQTKWQWGQNQLTILEATGKNFNSQGTITFNPDRLGAGVAGIQAMNLAVKAKDLDAAKVKPFLPAELKAFPLASTVEVEGLIKGTPRQPQVNLAVAMTNSRLANLNLDQNFKGYVAIDRDGLSLNLRDEEDYISAQFDPNYQPVIVSVNHPQLKLDLQRSGSNVAVQLDRFNIDNLRYLPQLKGLTFNPAVTRTFPNGLTENLGGVLTAKADVDLKDNFAWGTIAIDQPTVSNIKGDRLALEFQRKGQNLSVAKGEFRQADGMGNYEFNGRFKDGNNWEGQINFADVKTNDVLVAARLGRLEDVLNLQQPSTALKQGNLSPIELGLSPNATLEQQLQRISEIAVLNRQRRQTREDESLIPPLLDLDGLLNGAVALKNDRGQLAMDFDVNGKDWNWDDRYQASNLVLKGSMANSQIKLADLTLELRSLNNPRRTGGLFSMKGLIGDTQQLQVSMENFPVADLNQFVSLPPSIGFDGLVNLRSNITGKLVNPKAIGSIEVKDVTINNTAIASTVGSFSYNIGEDPAQLEFFIGAQLKNDQKPLSIEGTIPYKLPFADISPNNFNLNIALNVENEGFTLLNILSKDQLRWLAGEGSAQLKISGQFNPQEEGFAQALLTEGKVQLKDAKIASQFLPNDPLTNVNGDITFDLNQVTVNNFSGKFGGGNVEAVGSLPIIFSRNLDNPLTINLDRLGLKLKNIYNGGVAGNIQVLGSALSPVITGNIDLFEGQVELTDGATAAAAGDDNPSYLVLRDLQLNLKDKIQITRRPILNFLAEGTLLVNGSLQNLSPVGTINLKRGQVNLFTSRMTLASGQEHVAIFEKDRGLDPFLDVVLAASVGETVRTPQQQNPLSAEINDVPASSLGELQTVRVRADVEGYASEMTESLSLTSNPERSETEIISLLGGSFVDTFGRGETTLGLANLAGSALLGSVQDRVGQVLGLSEFRLFPTTAISEKGRSATLGLGAEASVDVGKDLSVSVLKLLTTEQPGQFGLRYRLTAEAIIRGSTDFAGDSRGGVEYNIRF